MKKLVLISLLCFLGGQFVQAQNFTYNKEDKERLIKRGTGQEFDRSFIPIGDFHFVQFGVYPADVDLAKIGAPPAYTGQVWLIFHEGTRIRGSNADGAIYIVKSFGTAEDARKAVKDYEAKGTSCWYNADLTEATFVLIGITPY